MVALIAENVDPREMGIATGMNTVVRMVGSVVGGQARRRAADGADDREHVRAGRVRLHLGVRAQRRDGVRRRGDRGVDHAPAAATALRAGNLGQSVGGR